MKVLFIAHYKDGHSGWAKAAQNYIRALDAVGVDVVPRAVKLNNSPPDVHPRVAELESKSAKGCDIIVQNVLPHWMERIGGVPNVGMCFFESQTLNMSPWVNRLKLMDSVITSNRKGIQLLDYCQIKNYRIQIPEEFPDTDNIEPFDIPALHGKYVFYFIGEFTKRKNIAGIIRGFNQAFTPKDNAALVLKLGKFGASPQDLQTEASKFVEDIKRGMKLPKYNREILITDRLSDDQVMRLHKTGNCLINASFGEGSCMPVWNALAFGNSVVAPEGCGIDQTDSRDIITYQSYPDLCFGEGDNFPFLFTGNDVWETPNIKNFASAMQYALRRGNKKVNSQNIRETLSFHSIGEEMKKCLEKQLSQR